MIHQQWLDTSLPRTKTGVLSARKKGLTKSVNESRDNDWVYMSRTWHMRILNENLVLKPGFKM